MATGPTTPFVPSSSYYYYSSYYYSSSAVPTSTWVTHALTTVFTPPAWCANSRLFTSWKYDHHTLVATRDYIEDTDCYPPDWYAGAFTGLNEVYSPGVCPSGWPSKATTVLSGTTTAACCPSGMTYLNSQYCGRYYSQPTTIAIDANTNSSITTPFVGLDYHILVAWASSDLTKFTPTSAPVLNTANSTKTSSLPILTHTKAQHTRPTYPSQSVEYVYYKTPLSAGAAAGIGIAAILFSLTLAGSIAFFVLWRKERRKRMAAEESAKLIPAEKEDSALRKNSYPEIDGIPLAELDKTSIRPESPLTEMPESLASESLASRSGSPTREHGEEV